MKILMLSDSYPPEMTANARIFSELSELWVQQGQQVSVITSHPNFPRGKIFPGFKNKWISKELIAGVEVIRVKTYMYPNKGFLRRTLDFFSFGISAFFRGLRHKDIDVVIGVTPQFFCALSACCLSIIKRKPYVVILCDLWPDSVVANKLLAEGFVYKLLKRIEIWMYKKSKNIVILSEYFRKYLHNLGIADDKIITSISGVSDNFFPRAKNKQILDNYKLAGKFVVGYIGTFGISHNHKDILLVAQVLQRSNDNRVHFLLIGDGAKREQLAAEQKRLGLLNFTIDGPFAKDDIPNYWSVVDVAVVPLMPTITNTTVLPSKILEAMAMGMPIILYAPDGEARKFLTKAQSGWYIPANDVDKLQELITKLAVHKDEMLVKQNNATNFARKFTRKNQAKYLLAYLELIQQPRFKNEKI